MPAPLRIHLSEEEDTKLLEFQKIEGIAQRTQERAEIIRLNHHGWSVEEIAKYKQKSAHTVRTSLHRWSNQGWEGLWEKVGRARNSKWKEEDIRYIENCLKFLDESGFCLSSRVSYSYARIGQQKVLQQTKRRGRRLNILGFYSVGVRGMNSNAFEFTSP